MKVLVLGISGALARQVALELHARGHTVSGIDRRPWFDAPKDVEVHRVDLRKRAAEDVFRKVKPDAVVHMATVTSLMVKGEERHRINVDGTRTALEYAHAQGVKSFVFAGRHTFYGATPDSPLYHTEEEPPQGLNAFPELADLVAADLLAGAALWRYPQMNTAVLRMVYTLGPSRVGTLATFIRGRRVPMVLGYDPLFQFMSDEDAASAVATTVEKKLKGVFNVAGPAPVPLSVIVKQAGKTAVPLPEGLLSRLLGHFGLPSMPVGALQHIKFPVVVDGTQFAKASGFVPRYDEVEVLRRYRALEASSPRR